MRDRTPSDSRRASSFGLVASFVVSACAAHPRQHPATSETAEPERPQSTGWVSLENSGPRDSEASYRVEVIDRRRELLDRCDAVLETLEGRLRAMGSVGSQVATSLVTQALVGAGSMAQSTAAGQPTAPPVPTPGGVNVADRVRYERQAGAIRENRHAVVAADSTRAILEAMDRLRPHCTPPR